MSSPGICCVVGATGFVGSHVTCELLKKGYGVRATCRDTSKAEWLRALDSTGLLELHSLTLTPAGFDVNSNPLDALVDGCKAVFMCAGYEKQEPDTIDFMVNTGLAVMNAAAKNSMGHTCVVLTSSTGSTNPAGAVPDAIKNETEFISDPEVQKANNRFSPAAKTYMEAAAFDFIGRDHQNQVVSPDKNPMDRIRLCIMNPSLILGPQLQPGPVSGNGLPWFSRIAKNEAMSEQIPNDSMSIIHVQDLALLHIACVETETASGRYFGVNQSWAWEDILAELQKVHPPYTPPAKKYESLNPVTRFNNDRRDSLGVKLRPLEHILGDTVKYLIEKGLL